MVAPTNKPQQLNIAEREAALLTIVAINGNLSYAKMAEIMREDERWPKYSPQLAWEDFHNALRRFYSPAEVAITRGLVHVRLNALLASAMPLALTNNWQAYDRVLNTLDQLRKLMGLDAPVKVDLRAQVDVATEVAASALTVALESVELTSEQRATMLETMRTALRPPAEDAVA